MENTALTLKKEKEHISMPCILSCIYFISMPLSIVSVIHGFSLLKGISLLVGGILIIRLFIGENKFSFNTVHLFFSIYVLYSITGLLISRSTYAVDTVKGLIENLIVIVLITMRVYNKREKRFIEWTWLLVGLISIVLGLSSHVLFGDDRTTISILNGQEDPNQFCGYFILPIIFAWERLTRQNEKWKVLYIIYIFLIIFIGFKTGSRGGLLAMIVPSIFYVLIATKGIKNKMILIVSVAIGTLLFIAVLYPMLPSSITERFSVAKVQEDKGSGRFDIWQTLLSEVSKDKKAMIVGFGIGSTEKILPAQGFESGYAHNQWIQVLTDQGLIGLTFFTLVISSGFFRNFKKRKVACAAIIGAVTLTMSLTLYVFKPFLDALLITAMTYEGELKYENTEIPEQG